MADNEALCQAGGKVAPLSPSPDVFAVRTGSGRMLTSRVQDTAYAIGKPWLARKKGSDMPQGTPLVEAAEILGVSADSLRKRARRGTVEAYKQGEEWYVVVPNGTSRSQATSHATARARQATDEPLEQAIAVVIATLREQLQVKDQQIAEKDMQLTERDRQLAAREREVSELHVLLQSTQRLIPSVVTEATESPTHSAPKPVQPNSEPSIEKQGAPWWRRFFLGEI